MDGSFLLVPVLSLVVLLAARVFFVRQVYRLLMVSLRRPKLVALAYALLLFPGVLVHEVSHWLCAKLLFVSTQGISLRPQLSDRGTIRLGYVKVADGGTLRNALIGFAPFAVGALLISWITLYRLQLGALYEGLLRLDVGLCADALHDALEVPHSAIWLYILLTVATTMLPSASDRKAWIPAGSVLICLLVLVWFLWRNPLSPNWLVIMKQMMNSVSAAFLIVAGMQVVVSFPLWSIQWLIARWSRA